MNKQYMYNFSAGMDREWIIALDVLPETGPPKPPAEWYTAHATCMFYVNKINKQYF